jgi:hypothetical protein
VCEPVVSVKGIIAKIVEKSSMKLRGSGTGHDLNLAARCAAELHGISRGLQPEFLHGINGDETVDPSNWGSCVCGSRDRSRDKPG